VCLWIIKDKRSAGILLPTCRLEDERFISETLCTVRSCKILLKKYCTEVSTVFPL